MTNAPTETLRRIIDAREIGLDLVGVLDDSGQLTDSERGWLADRGLYDEDTALHGSSSDDMAEIRGLKAQAADALASGHGLRTVRDRLERCYLRTGSTAIGSVIADLNDAIARTTETSSG
jgi:hypothetical protein